MRAYVVPVFGKRTISSIGRYDVEMFLTEREKQYSKNTIRSMRASLSVVLEWAKHCDWVTKDPCSGVRLTYSDDKYAGRKVLRTVLTAEEVKAIANKLEEPYATLVLFLAISGLRIGEAIAIKWSDFDWACPWSETNS